MTAEQPVQGVLRIEFGMENDTVAFGSRMFWGNAGLALWSAEDADLMLSAFITDWTASLAPLISNTVRLHEVTVTDLSTDTAVQLSSTPDVVATNINPEGSAASCLNVTYSAPRRYRGGHARTALGGIPDSARANSKSWAAGYLASAELACTAFFESMGLTPISGGTPDHVIIHRQSRVLNPVAPYLLTPPQVEHVSSFGLDSTIGTQRKRLRSTAP